MRSANISTGFRAVIAACAVLLALVMNGCEGASSTAKDDLNVTLWIVAISDYQGESDSRVSRMMDEFRRLYSVTGITIGTVKHRVLTGSTAERLTFQDLDRDNNNDGWPDDMAELFQLSSQGDNNNLHIFFVRDIQPTGILGVAGDIPGPASKGTTSSGVVVNTFGGFGSMSDSDLLLQGNTIAHEGGHYLGLYHTTERTGTDFDPLADTPECKLIENDANFDGIVDSDECEEHDGPNLMFWAAASYPQETVTDDQNCVLVSHELVGGDGSGNCSNDIIPGLPGIFRR